MDPVFVQFCSNFYGPILFEQAIDIFMKRFEKVVFENKRRLNEKAKYSSLFDCWPTEFRPSNKNHPNRSKLRKKLESISNDHRYWNNLNVLGDSVFMAVALKLVWPKLNRQQHN